MSILEAIVLGLVQGLTEFIPISSTGHLKIVPELLGWGDPGAAVSAVIQFGTILAVIIYFFRDIVRLTVGFFRGLVARKPFGDPDSREAWYVIFATIPIVVVGVLLEGSDRRRVPQHVGGHVPAGLHRHPDAGGRGVREAAAASGRGRTSTRRTPGSSALGQCIALIPGLVAQRLDDHDRALPPRAARLRGALLVRDEHPGDHRRGRVSAVRREGRAGARSA